MLLRTHLYAAVAVATGAAAQYQLVDNYNPTNFFKSFDFFSQPDPTHGHVRYLAAPQANSKSLAGFALGGVYLGLDSRTAAPKGRDSVRVSSKKAYTKGLFIADISHMPSTSEAGFEGCGVWPAFWMFGPGWPNGGEIDILEGVNDQDTNAVTLHTGPGCVMSNDGVAEGSGQLAHDDCNEGAGAIGCGAKTQIPYGASFNAGGGGVYAMEWTSEAISVWFWPAGDAALPADVIVDNPNPSSWGPPAARFVGGSGCDIDAHFKAHNIVFNTATCGDWAGAIWSEGKCGKLAPTCNEYVTNNPGVFSEAYWIVKSVKVFERVAKKSRRAVVWEDGADKMVGGGVDSEGTVVPSPFDL